MKLVTRAEWQARPPKSRTAASPSFGSTVHYEGPTLGAYPHTSCASKVRGIQAFHMDTRRWSDLAYTALVCRHGFTFEGRWLGIRNGANGTTAGNRDAYAVCALIGVGDDVTPELEQELVDVLAYLDEASAGAGVNGHRDWKATACPGAPLYDLLPSLRVQKAAALAAADTTTDEELFMPPISKNAADARDARVRERFHSYFGRAPSWEEYVLFLKVLEQEGAGPLEVKLEAAAKRK